MKAYIITGTSKGLGKAIVEEIMATESAPRLYCLSRNVNEDLISTAAVNDIDMDYISYDLKDLMGIQEIMKDIIGELVLVKEELEGIYLVNNAGVVGPVKAIEHVEPEGLITNIHVNLIAPMLLSSAFIKLTKPLTIEKRIMNISSGAADHGFYGWSAYCASKAGVNIFTETVGIEQSYQDHGVKILSLAPGIVDTGMQEEIRQATEEEFRDVGRFVAFKENGDLMHPEVVAKDTVKLLHHRKYPMGANLDIGELEAYIN